MGTTQTNHERMLLVTGKDLCTDAQGLRHKNSVDSNFQSRLITKGDELGPSKIGNNRMAKPATSGDGQITHIGEWENMYDRHQPMKKSQIVER